MDVGCSSNLDTYSIIEDADYSFAELSCDILAEASEDEFSDIRDRLSEYKTKPLIWSGLEETHVDFSGSDIEDGFAKDQLIDLFFRIDVIQGEYVIIKHNLDKMSQSPEEYVKNLNDISDLAGSYGLEIILLVEGETSQELISNYDKIKLLNIDHPFLRLGFDLCNIEDLKSFFDTIDYIDNVLYYRFSAESDNFKDNFVFMVDKFADTDAYLTVWSNLGEIADKVVSKKYME